MWKLVDRGKLNYLRRWWGRGPRGETGLARSRRGEAVEAKGPPHGRWTPGAQKKRGRRGGGLSTLRVWQSPQDVG